MTARREIRADYDRDTIVVYQAYPAAIAEPAIAAQRFVAPFSLTRMTWIKPSFCWLMHRSNGGQKAGQERTLGVRIYRAAWERALALGVLTSPEPAVFRNADEWDRQFRDDMGGFGVRQGIAIFGTPGTRQFEFVLSGRHGTMRCDGNSADHVAFGGPILY